jgi:broad specificity phosphatase PhoE
VLILARHGQTEANAGGRLQGRIDNALTSLGHEQAKAIAAAVHPAIVVSSPLLRAQQTAAYFETDVLVDDRWTELDYGELDGALITDLPATMWDRWRKDPAWAPRGGESLIDVGQRVRAACEEVAARAVEEDVLVVTHVSPVKAAVAWALRVGDEIAWRMFLDVAAITKVRVTAAGAALVAFNDCSHLHTPSATA